MFFELHSPCEMRHKLIKDEFPQIQNEEYYCFGNREFVELCSFESIQNFIDLFPGCYVTGSICEQKIDIIPKDWRDKYG